MFLAWLGLSPLPLTGDVTSCMAMQEFFACPGFWVHSLVCTVGLEITSRGSKSILFLTPTHPRHFRVDAFVSVRLVWASGWCGMSASGARYAFRWCSHCARGYQGSFVVYGKSRLCLAGWAFEFFCDLKKLCESARPRKIWKQELLPPRKLRSGLSCSYLQAIYEIQISNFANGLNI